MNPEMALSTTERTKRLERLLEISRTLSASLDLEPFLHSLISVASELTGCEAASILELEEGDTQLHFLALPWFHREVLRSIKVPLQNSVAGWVLENGQPAVVPDVTLEPRHFKGADSATEYVTRSLMAVPISYQGEKLGVLEVVNKTGDAHYTEEDLTILETLASQAAIAIQNTRLMNRVQKTRDEMTQLDRMKSDFIAIASHELRTPLGLILGHATFLREVIQPEFRSQLDIIVRNAMRLKEIIDSIANMDNAQRGMASIRAHSVSIRRVVEEVMDSFQQEAEKKHITMRSDLGQSELTVEGDASKISIALSNMVQNAVIFTNPNGHVFIVAEQIPGYVKVSVIDDGIGIPPKDLPHIFERFYQVESHLTRKHGGMGLGLSVAKVMVEMHGGRIWAESVEGKGSNFTFILPVNSGQADAANRVFVP
ncbi:MAG TPA: ATP-binding protein [Anaerolineales bacterium]|nr:ATP-binding protein [Anaerolineales bacterium]